VHYVQQMYHHEKNFLSCVLEVMIAHVNMNIKKTAAFPAAIQAKIDSMLQAHKALTLPPQVGHKIGIPRKT
jgi:acyl-CoA thioester hydrolase